MLSKSVKEGVLEHSATKLVLEAARFYVGSIGIKVEFALVSRATKVISVGEAGLRSLGSGDNSILVKEVSRALRSMICASYFMSCESVDYLIVLVLRLKLY